jgi:hypothetical protein
MSATERGKEHALWAIARMAAVPAAALATAGVALALPQILDSGSEPAPSLGHGSGVESRSASTPGAAPRFVLPSLPAKKPAHHRSVEAAKPVSQEPAPRSSTPHTTPVSRPVHHSSGGRSRPTPSPTPTPPPTTSPTITPPPPQPTIGTASHDDESSNGQLHIPPGQAKKGQSSPPYGHAYGYYKHHDPPGQARKNQAPPDDDNDGQNEDSHGNGGNGHSHGRGHSH